MAFKMATSPLEIPHILDIIATYLPIQDIRSCRLVNKLWSEEMTRNLQNRYVLFVDGLNLGTAEKVVKKKRTGHSIVVQNIVIINGITYENKIFFDVLESFGSTLASLVVSRESVKWSISLLHKVLTQYAPNLERFVFIDEQGHYVYSGGLGIVHEYSNALVSALRKIEEDLSFPKLQVLEWDEGHPVDIVDLYALFPNLKTLRVAQCVCLSNYISPFEILNWRRLEYIEIHSEVLDINLFTFLKCLQLKLKEFSLIYSQVTESHEYIEKEFTEFIASIASALIRIDIRYLPIFTQPRPFNVTLPYLPKLRRLKIFSSKVSPFNIENLSRIPRLESFHCSYATYNEESEEPLPLGLYRSLQSVKAVIEYDDFLLKICDVFTLTRLTVHSYQIGDDDFRRVITQCPYLIKLSVSYLPFRPFTFPSELLITDSAITGIPEDALYRLPEEIDKIENVSALRKYPWIGNLKCLRYFSVAGAPAQLTKFSVLYGVNYVTTLIYFYIHTDSLSEQKLWRCRLNQGLNEKCKRALSANEDIDCSCDCHSESEGEDSEEPEEENADVNDCNLNEINKGNDLLLPNQNAEDDDSHEGNTNLAIAEEDEGNESDTSDDSVERNNFWSYIKNRDHITKDFQFSEYITEKYD